MSVDAGPAAARHRYSRTVLRTVLSVGLVVAIFAFAFPKVADLSEVFATVRAMTWAEVSTLAVAAAWNMVTYWAVMVIVLPGLHLHQAMIANLTGGAIANTVPGGGALAVGMTFAMFGSWGFSRTQIGLSVLVSGVWNTFVKLGLPVIALALLAIYGRVGPGLVTGALIGVGILAVVVAAYALMLRSRTFAHRLGETLGAATSSARRIVRRAPVQGWGDATVRMRDETIGLIQDRWLRLTVASLVSHLALFGVLLLALRHVGVSEGEVSWVEVLGAFAFMRLLSAVPITPGGLGVVELGLTAALVVAGGDRAQVLAAVLLYRAVTWLPTVPAGAVTYVAWRSRQGRLVASPVSDLREPSN